MSKEHWVDDGWLLAALRSQDAFNVQAGLLFDSLSHRVDVMLASGSECARLVIDHFTDRPILVGDLVLTAELKSLQDLQRARAVGVARP